MTSDNDFFIEPCGILWNFTFEEKFWNFTELPVLAGIPVILAVVTDRR